MAQEGRKYLLSIVNSVICLPDAFRIGFGKEKFIFSVMGKDATTNEYFAVSAIYDSICDIDSKIKHAFNSALACDFPENMNDYAPFLTPPESEKLAMYHVENMVFRISILWDLLAQLCIVILRTGIETEKNTLYSIFQEPRNRK